MAIPSFRSLLVLAVFSGGALARAAFPAASPDDPTCTAEDRMYMKRAYELARYATTHGGAPFGALLVKDGKILAEYANCEHLTGDVTKHAETGLISTFSPKIDRATFAQSTLYTSSEPCTMCCGSIRFAGIGRVVFGTYEEKFEEVIGIPPPAHALRCRETLERTAPNIRVQGPLMEAEGLQVHEEYWPTHPIRHGAS